MSCSKLRTTTEGSSCQSAKNTFIKLLNGKKPSDDGTLARAKMIRHMEDLKELTEHLLDNVHKIEDAKIAIMSARDVAMLDTRKRKKSMLDSEATHFEGKSVGTFLKVPHQFLWQFIENVAIKPIPQEIRGSISKKSIITVRCVVEYVTGMHGKFEIFDTLLCKEVLMKFLAGLYEKRGKLLDVGEGVFQELHENGELVWAGNDKHGCYYFGKTEGCPEGLVDIIFCRCKPGLKALLDPPIPAITKIHSNYSEHEAFFRLAKRKDYVKFFFKKGEIVKLTKASVLALAKECKLQKNLAASGQAGKISSDIIEGTKKRPCRPKAAPRQQ